MNLKFFLKESLINLFMHHR